MVKATGEGRRWSIGDRVILHSNDWLEERDVRTLETLRRRGAGDGAGDT